MVDDDFTLTTDDGDEPAYFGEERAMTTIRGLSIAGDADLETSAAMLKSAILAVHDTRVYRNAEHNDRGWHITVRALDPANDDDIEGRYVVSGYVLHNRSRGDELTIEPMSDDVMTATGFPTAIPWDRIITIEVS